MRVAVRTGFILCISFAVCLVQAAAQDKEFDVSVLTDRGKDAFAILTDINRFALGPTGYGGTTSKGELALDVLVREKDALGALRYLIGKARAEGGLYALLGLKILKCECFREEYERFRQLPESKERKSFGRLVVEAGNVEAMSGCIVFQEKRLKIAKDIADEAELIKWKIHDSPNRLEN